MTRFAFVAAVILASPACGPLCDAQPVVSQQTLVVPEGAECPSIDDAAGRLGASRVFRLVDRTPSGGRAKCCYGAQVAQPAIDEERELFATPKSPCGEATCPCPTAAELLATATLAVTLPDGATVVRVVSGPTVASGYASCRYLAHVRRPARTVARDRCTVVYFASGATGVSRCPTSPLGKGGLVVEHGEEIVAIDAGPRLEAAGSADAGTACTYEVEHMTVPSSCN